MLGSLEAVKDFFLKNRKIVSWWHQKAKEETLKYAKISEFKEEKYLEENIRLMIEDNDAGSISEFFRVIDCLSYNKKDILDFEDLEELLKSGYELSILSLLIKSPIENLEERFTNHIFRLLESNEIYDWMARSDPNISESLKVKEKIVSFATYFSFIIKYSKEKSNLIRELGEWNLIKTSELLMNCAKDTNECVDEFFFFSCDVLKLYNIEFNFLQEWELNILIDNICSWHTFSNALNLASHIKIKQSTIQKLCQIIYDSFYCCWNAVLDFYTSGEEVLKISHNYLRSRYISFKNERSIDMMKKNLEALLIYTTNINKVASTLFDEIELEEFISEEGVLDCFIKRVDNIINAQLTIQYPSISLLNAYFETLPSIKDKSLKRAMSDIPRLALYFYLKKMLQDTKIRNIMKYLKSFISQFEVTEILEKDKILKFFKATFSFMPEIQRDFNCYLNEDLIYRWRQKKRSIKQEAKSSLSNQNLRHQKLLIANAIGLAEDIMDIQINSTVQFNYLAVNEFEEFIDTYISIIRDKDVKKLFLFYKEISTYLEDFNFNKISYEDSKSRVTIAKYFICLIKNALTEVFKEYANKLKEKLQDSEDKVIDSIESETLETKNSLVIRDISFEEESSEEENFIWMIKRALVGDQQIIGDPFWNSFLISREDQKDKLEEFRSSFLHKMVFSDGDENFILRQYLASHLTRLFNGTLNKGNTEFFTEAMQVTIKLFFNRSETLDKTQKEELRKIIISPPVYGAFKYEKIWNENISDLVERAYFADIPRNFSGITVFGGTILLQQSLSEIDDFKSCARKITFIHEAAHAMRKYNEGSYNPEKKTPKSAAKDLVSGMPGNTYFQDDFKEHEKNEGGKIIENAIFGAYFTKINKLQIDYINDLENWEQDSESFKSCIGAKGRENSKSYELARGNHYFSGMRNDNCGNY